MSLYRLTNSNKNVEEKINYFLARFFHFLENYGKEYQFDLENQLSIMQKLDFRLTNDNEHRLHFIDQILLNSIIYNKEIWGNYKSYPSVIKRIEDYRRIDETLSAKEIKKQKVLILDSAIFQNCIRELVRELNLKMADDLCIHLSSVLKCSYGLTEHNHYEKLDALAQLFVSSGYFSGKTFVEIRHIVKSIFEKQYKFPYPPDIKSRRDKRDYDLNRTLERQMMGFGEIVRTVKVKKLVVMRLVAPVFPEEFTFEYNGVVFLGIESKQIKKARESLNQDYLEAFFKDPKGLFILKQLTLASNHSIVERMKKETLNQIQFFSSQIGRNVYLDHGENYLILNNHWKIIGGGFSTEGYNDLKEHSIRNLENNAFKILHKIRENNAVAWFLKLEPMFVKAVKDRDSSGFWTYLEVLLSYRSKGEKFVMTNVSEILILNEKEEIENRVINTLHSTFDYFNGNLDLLKVDHSQIHPTLKSLRQRKIPTAIRAVKIPFIQKLISEFDDDLKVEHIA